MPSGTAETATRPGAAARSSSPDIAEGSSSTRPASPASSGRRSGSRVRVTRISVPSPFSRRPASAASRARTMRPERKPPKPRRPRASSVPTKCTFTRFSCAGEFTGTPATITTRSPRQTYPASVAARSAFESSASESSVSSAASGTTPQVRSSRRCTPASGVTAMMGCAGRQAATRRGLLPRSVGAMIAAARTSRAVWQALRATARPVSSSASSRRCQRRTRLAYSGEASTARAIRSMVSTAATGYAPLAVSPDSITASVPSKIALATSVASARVGRGLRIIESSICVAVMTGFRCSWHAAMMRFCASGISSTGRRTPRSPRATMMPSATRAMPAALASPSSSSIFAITCMRDPRSKRRVRTSITSSGRRTNEAATKSMSILAAKARCSASRSVTAGSFVGTPGTLTFLWLPSSPPERTTQRARPPSTAVTSRSMRPSAISRCRPGRSMPASPDQLTVTSSAVQGTASPVTVTVRPVSSITEPPPATGPVRISGPLMSTRRATGIPVARLASRSRPASASWYSSLPWAMLNRATFMPAASRALSTGTSEAVGPRVQTIFVFLNVMARAPPGRGSSGRGTALAGRRRPRPSTGRAGTGALTSASRRSPFPSAPRSRPPRPRPRATVRGSTPCARATRRVPKSRSPQASLRRGSRMIRSTRSASHGLVMRTRRSSAYARQPSGVKSGSPVEACFAMSAAPDSSRNARRPRASRSCALRMALIAARPRRSAR